MLAAGTCRDVSLQKFLILEYLSNRRRRDIPHALVTILWLFCARRYI